MKYLLIIGTFLNIFMLPTLSYAQQCSYVETGGQLGSNTGKKVTKAFEYYSQDDLDIAIEILKDIDPSAAYDRAYVNRYLGNMLAGADGRSAEALPYLKTAVDAELLSLKEQLSTTKLLADLSLQETNHEQAAAYYQKWLQWSCSDDIDVHVRLANAYYQLGEMVQTAQAARKAVSLSANNISARKLLMSALYEQQRYSEAAIEQQYIFEKLEPNYENFKRVMQFYLLDESYTLAANYWLTYAPMVKYNFLDLEFSEKIIQLFEYNEMPSAILALSLRQLSVFLQDETLGDEKTKYVQASLSKLGVYVDDLSLLETKQFLQQAVYTDDVFGRYLNAAYTFRLSLRLVALGDYATAKEYLEPLYNSKLASGNASVIEPLALAFIEYNIGNNSLARRYLDDIEGKIDEEHDLWPQMKAMSALLD